MLMLIQSVAEAQVLLPEKSPKLLVFVSFSMPEQSLKLWAKQVAKLNVPLRIRGFAEDSLEATTLKTLNLFGKEAETEVLIDPEAFSQFKIQAVPAVGLTIDANCLTEECTASGFDVVYGDTDLEQALRWIEIKGSTQGKELATQLLKRYRETHD